MERLLVRIVDDLRQAGVEFASPSRRCLRVDDRGEQRMREPDAAVADLQDSGGCRLLERGRPALTAGGGSHERDGRPRERRDDERRLPRRGGDSGEPLPNELVESRGHRQRLSRRGGDIAREQRPAKLEREERIASRHPLQLDERGAEELPAELRPQKAIE